jgi:hypothetical protein
MGQENFMSSLPVQLPHQLITSSTSVYFLRFGHWNFGFGIYLGFAAWNLVLYFLLVAFYL